MKTVKVLAVIGVVATMASQCFAASVQQLWRLSLNGSSYSANSESNKIESSRFSTRSSISDCTTNKGAQLVWATPANEIWVVDKCGNPLCQVAAFGSLTGPTIVKGAVTETLGTGSFETQDGGGYALCDIKWIVSSRGTNLVAACAGIHNNTNNEPGTVSFRVGGAFKPARDCAR